MKKNQYILLVTILLIAGLSFFAGTRYQLSKGNGRSLQAVSGRGTLSGQSANQKTQSSGGSRMQNGLANGGLVSGEIISKDGQSLTVKSNDGSTKIVIIADSTVYKKSSDASVQDLNIGEIVTIISSSNTDGSLTAKTVTLGETMIPTGQARPENLPENAAQISPLESK
jgi:hypothetical protein